jgi:thiol:disulfide interchange protein DsbC
VVIWIPSLKQKNILMRKIILALVLLPLTLSVRSGLAGEQEDIQSLRMTLQLMVPGKQADSIRPTPIPGLYEVVYGQDLLYVTADARYVVHGNIIDLAKKRDITEDKKRHLRLAALDALDEEQMIVYGPDSPRHTVTVFTDIDCPACRSLHRAIPDYIRHGIKVRYLAFPRSGIDTPSYDKAVSVWCAEDRNLAMDRAKRGEEPEPRTCDNPVKQQMRLGLRMGVTATPTLVLEDGRLLPGFVPAAQLAKLMDESGG